VTNEEQKRLEELIELGYERFAVSVIGHKPPTLNFYDN